MESTELLGTVEKLLYQSPDNGFCVFVLHLSNKTDITVRAHVAQLHPGQQVRLHGSWVTHPKFGKQFQATTCAPEMPTSFSGLQKYLSSGLIKGIGPVYAQKLLDFFGTDVLKVIDTQPERLKQVPGIGPKRVQQILDGWKDQKEISSIMVFLQDKGISPAYAVKIFKKYGSMSIAVVQENPYRLAEELWGIGFKIADQIARGVGIATDSVKRVKAGILYLVGQEASSGHGYVQLDAIKEKTILLLELSEDSAYNRLRNALHELYNEDKIKLVSVGSEHFIAIAMYYYTEKAISQQIHTLQQHASTLNIDATAVYATLRCSDQKRGIELNEDQQRGIMSCLQHKVSIITGGPGTGKTTTIKQLLSVLDEHSVAYKLAAPTGRAAKRITESTGRPALTIHRLLEFDFATHRFTKNEHNSLKLDMLIIDEASMIDVYMAHAILKAVPFAAHVLFIGDIDQLPSVGPGNFLNDLIASERVACMRLTQIFRQAQDSLIIVNAHKVNNGEFPVSSLENGKKDFLLIKQNDPEMVAQQLQEMIFKRLPSMGIQPDQTTILVPMNRGVVGTHALNQQLQQMFNGDPQQKQITAQGTTFKVGDRVMQIRNNYDKIVFNGDCGIIVDINSAERVIQVQFAERTLEYESNELDELVLAYAISIHKSQGSEYDAVIIPLFMQHFMLLQRNLLYTAITRAKKMCILLGQPKAIAIAIGNDKGIVRKTFLKEFLTSDLACR